MNNIIYDILKFLINPPASNWFLILKIIFIFFSAFFLFFIVFAIFKTSWIKYLFLFDLIEFLTYRPFGIRKITKQWQKITARLETGIESEAKLALIEADSLLDDILKRMGYSGETLADRLKSVTKEIIPNIAEIWEAHKIRNNIVHDPDYRLNLDQAKRALETYEEALKSLDVF